MYIDALSAAGSFGVGRHAVLTVPSVFSSAAAQLVENCSGCKRISIRRLQAPGGYELLRSLP